MKVPGELNSVVCTGIKSKIRSRRRNITSERRKKPSGGRGILGLIAGILKYLGVRIVQFYCVKTLRAVDTRYMRNSQGKRETKRSAS
ncbi:hypothetical protein M9H77_11142 [Catharanthus roseus]|uniref:Uncharacterized protein n=1 Tax=Catharanthus roseus TaxID=4058 RepID=A0ACC0BDZ0_CATRO|nr:hypothetical protein M9H77_11142 [Catharanthus roseus]